MCCFKNSSPAFAASRALLNARAHSPWAFYKIILENCILIPLHYSTLGWIFPLDALYNISKVPKQPESKTCKTTLEMG